jgi:predicted NUDIX family NTP pyrophosphohydrolase
VAPPRSAGILLFRQVDARVEVLLVKPGGPFWKKRDIGAWMIPKGQIEAGEQPVEAALREFAEETGTALTAIPLPLCQVRQAAGKVVEAFAVEGDLDETAIISSEFELEWPRGSGRKQMVPEVGEARWFGLFEARAMMLPSQLPILDALERELSA